MTMLIIFALAALTTLPLFFLIIEIVLFAKAKGDDAKRKKLKIAIIITSIVLGIVLIALILLAGLMMTAIMYM